MPVTQQDEADRRMIQQWCKSAFKAGWTAFASARTPGQRDPASTSESQFQAWFDNIAWPTED